MKLLDLRSLLLGVVCGTAIGIGLIATAYDFGWILQREPQVITEYKYITTETIKEVPVEVVKEVEVVKYVDRPVPTHPTYRLFKDMDEFKQWERGLGITFLGGKCGDLALTFTEQIIDAGYIPGGQIVNPTGVIIWTPVRLAGKNGHVGITIMTADRQVWYYEPETRKVFYIAEY